MLRALLTLLILSWTFGEAARAEQLGTEQLVAFASEANPQLEKGIEDSFSERDLEGGVAWSGHLHDFFCDSFGDQAGAVHR